jgi:putative endonuclease
MSGTLLRIKLHMSSPLPVVSSPGLPPHLVLGEKGEVIAVRFLKDLGYDIRGTNVRIGRDEIDILAHDPFDDVIVFVEVKTRSHLRSGFLPEKTASWKKRAKLKRAARRWVANNHYDGGYRMDLICVRDGKVKEHFLELSWDGKSYGFR